MNPHICMLRQIKGIISGQIVYNYKAYNNEQGRQKNLWGSGQNYIWDPYSKVLRIPLNQALMPYTCPSVDWALLNFRLFLKLGPPSRFGAQGKSLPLPPPCRWPWLWMPLCGDIFSCQFCVFQSSFDTWITQQSYLLFLFQANLKNTCKVLLGKLKRQMQEIKGTNGCFNLTFYI